MNRASLLYVVIGLAAFGAFKAAAQSTYTWTGQYSPYDYWTNSLAWSPNGVPSGSGNAITLGSGDIYLTSDEQLAGVNWNGGDLGNAANGGLYNLTVSSFLTLNAAADSQQGLNLNQLINNGQMLWSGTGNYTVNGTAAIENNGIFTINVNSGFSATGNGNSGSGTVGTPADEPSLGVIYNNANATLNKTGGGTMTFNGPSGNALVNAGTVNVLAGTVSANITVLNSGNMYQARNTTNLFNGSYVQTGGTYDISNNAVLAGNVNIQGGVLMGNGTVNNYGPLVVTNGAIIDPGDGWGQAGRLTVSNAVNLNGAILQIDIGGTNAGISYDQLETENYASLLGGTLDVSLTDGFDPATNDIFEIVYTSDGTALQGNFSNATNGQTILTTDGSGSFTVDYGTGTNAGNVYLSDYTSATPEPTPLALMAVTIIAGGAWFKFIRFRS